MSKLRIAFYSPLGHFKGWQALRKLELWARETNILIPRQLPKDKRLVNLFEQFRARLSRGQRAGLILCRERRGLRCHKSYYRNWLMGRGFPGRKKPKVVTQPGPTNPYIAYQQAHPSSLPPGFLVPPDSHITEVTFGNAFASVTAPTPQPPQNGAPAHGHPTVEQMEHAFLDDVFPGPEHA